MSTSRQRTGLVPAALPDMKAQQLSVLGYEQDTASMGVAQPPSPAKVSQGAGGMAIYGIRNPVSGGIEYASKVFIPALPDDGSTDQTSLVQSVLNGCRPGQSAVLPPPLNLENRYVRCGAIKIPSGVSLESGGSVALGWTVKFSPSISQAYNSEIGRIWFKQSKFIISDVPDNGTAESATASSVTDTDKTWAQDQWAGWYVRTTGGTGSGQTKLITGNDGDTLDILGTWTTQPDATTAYELICNISAITFDGTQIDGTNTSHAGSTAGNAIEIGQFGFDVKLINGAQIWNYTGWGMAVFGNSDNAANTGDSYLATGVFMNLTNVKMFNLGGAGSGGAILLRGGPKDGGSLHLTNVLLDHCQSALYVDDSVSGVPANASSGSGGLTVVGNNLRIELCGRTASGGTETPAITNIRGNITILGLWMSSAITTSGYKTVWHRSGTFRALGGRCTTGAAGVWAILADPGETAVFDAETNFTNNRVAGRESITASEDSGSELMSYRLRITKGASGVTVQCMSGSGFGWGLGSTAGDRVSSAVSAQITAGGASASVGSNYTQMYFQLTAGGGSLQVTHAYKQFSKVLGASIQKQTAGITPLYADVQLLNGNANFNIIFSDASGAEKNIVSAMSSGQYIDVAVTLAALR